MFFSLQNKFIHARLLAGVAAMVTLLAASPVRAEDSIGGHIGFVLPLVTRANGQTTTLADGFSMAFPVGITVKSQGPLAFDMEIVPAVQGSPRFVSTTIHPGMLWALKKGYTVGLRAAFAVNSSEVGFTPLVNKSWPIKDSQGFFKAYFVEAVLPVRFDRPASAPASQPVTFAMHFGVGF